MVKSPSGTRSTIRRLAPVLLVGLLGACAAAGPVQRFPRLPRYIAEPVKQISLRGGHLGWGGVEIGMTFRQVELAAGRRLPSLGSAAQDELCGYYTLETNVLKQPLRLEFDAKGGESRLAAIWLPLANPAGEPSVPEIARALKARFPDLRYLPSPHAPDLAESVNPRPLYRGQDGRTFFIDPRQGVYFGEICVD
jgi:hypothetical protein